MADGRMLKKQISRSKKLARLKTDSARMLYTWIIPHLDIEGRLEADPHIVKGEVVPRLETFTPENIQEYLEDMAAEELIILYHHEGDQFLQLVKFEDHQSLRKDKEAASRIPAPSQDISAHTPVQLPEDSGTTPDEAKQREEKLREEKQRELPDSSGRKAALLPKDKKKDRSALPSKKSKDEKPYSPTPKEDIQRMGDEVAHAEIDAAKVALFTSGIFPEVQRFMKIAAGKNPRAVLHTLTQCYQQKPKNPGGYCRTVLEKENANFNESDALRLKKSVAPSRDEAKNILKMIRGGGQTESEP